MGDVAKAVAAAAAKKKAKTHCPNGHEYTPENTGVTVKQGGRWITRYCKTCKKTNERRCYDLLRIHMMNPKDERHGTRRGVIDGGCRCPKCRLWLHENGYK